MTTPPYDRPHVAPCFCDACVEERVATISASHGYVVDDFLRGSGSRPVFTEEESRALREWAKRNIFPLAVLSTPRHDDLFRDMISANSTAGARRIAVTCRPSTRQERRATARRKVHAR